MQEIEVRTDGTGLFLPLPQELYKIQQLWNGSSTLQASGAFALHECALKDAAMCLSWQPKVALLSGHTAGNPTCCFCCFVILYFLWWKENTQVDFFLT